MLIHFAVRSCVAFNNEVSALNRAKISKASVNCLLINEAVMRDIFEDCVVVGRQFIYAQKVAPDTLDTLVTEAFEVTLDIQRHGYAIAYPVYLIKGVFGEVDITLTAV